MISWPKWHEPNDDAGNPDSEKRQDDRTRRDVAFSVKITDAKSYARRSAAQPQGGIAEHTIEPGDDLIGVNLATERAHVTTKSHEFHDTRYRRISYRLDATTKFREFLPTKFLTEEIAGQRIASDKKIKVTGPTAVT